MGLHMIQPGYAGGGGGISHPDSVDGFTRKVHSPLELKFQEIIQSNTPKPWDHTHFTYFSMQVIGETLYQFIRT